MIGALGALTAEEWPSWQCQQLRVLPYDVMAERIAMSGKVSKGERVLLRVHKETMPDLAPVLQKRLERDGATVETLPDGPAPDLEERLQRTDVYVWLPAPASATPPDQSAALAGWIDRGGGRELHFHWTDGTRQVNGLPARIHPRSTRCISMRWTSTTRRSAAKHGSGDCAAAEDEVRVTTPAGTNLTFRVGDRPFNKQDGDGSKARASRGRMRIDRHIELPAGVVRVAPLEESVNGTMVVPSMPFLTAKRPVSVSRLNAAESFAPARARIQKESPRCSRASLPPRTSASSVSASIRG